MNDFKEYCISKSHTYHASVVDDDTGEVVARVQAYSSDSLAEQLRKLDNAVEKAVEDEYNSLPEFDAYPESEQ